MDYSGKTVTEIPLDSLWNDDGALEALRIRHLSSDDIQSCLDQGPVSFVLANVGDRLSWIEPESQSEFWNSDAKFRVVFPDEEIFLDDYPDGYCYVASEWSPFAKGILILLEKYQ